jgi:hypothetical protein
MVTLAKEVGWRGVVREGVHDLLGGPVGRWVLGDVEVDHTAAMVGEHEEDKEHTQAGAGDSEEIDSDDVPDMVGEERAPGLRRGARRFGISRETVRSATSMPSFLSSPWILGALPATPRIHAPARTSATIVPRFSSRHPKALYPSPRPPRFAPSIAVTERV